MLNLRNKTGAASKVGYLVKAVRGGFKYAAAGDTPIGVVTQTVPRGSICEIQTEGNAMIYVGETAQAGQELRMKNEDERGPAGQAFLIGDVSNYVSVGYTLSHGRGLVEVTLNIGSVAGGAGGGGGIEEAPLTGSQYARQSAAWSVVSSIADATPNSIAYSRYNNNWVNANLVIDRSGGLGAQTAIVNYGQRLTFVGDGTYISTSYSYEETYANVHQIKISLDPGALDTKWHLKQADGQDPTPRPILETIEIGNTSNVVFLNGVYTSVVIDRNVNLGDYDPALDPPQPANEVTVDLKLTELTNHYNTVYAPLADNATQTWVTANSDNYDHWKIKAGGYPVDTISSAETLNFAAGNLMSITYDEGTNTLTYAGVTPTATTWTLLANGGSAVGISNGMKVNLIDGTGISITKTFDTPSQTDNVTFTNSNPSKWTLSGSAITYAGSNSSNAQNVMYLDTSHWFGIHKNSGYGTINWFNEASGGVWVNTHASVKASMIAASSGEIQFWTAATNSGDGAASNMTQRMTIDDGGNVGIGTTTPDAPLEISGVGGDMLRLTDTNGTVTTSTAILSFYYGATPTRLGYVGYGSGSNSVLYVNNDNGNDINLQTSGNVGINDSTPSYKLDVNGDGRFTNRLYANGAMTIASPNIPINFHETTANNYARLVFDANTMRYDFCDDGDGVFIPYNSPLSMVNGGAVTIRYNGATRLYTTSGGVNVIGTLTVSSHIYQGDSDIHYFGNSNDGAIFHDGTTSLYVQSKIHGGDIRIQAETTGGTNRNMIIANPDAGVTMYWGPTGGAKFTTASGGITVTGNVIATGEVESYDTSDIRFKEILNELNPEEATKALMTLDLIRYRHKVKDKIELGIIYHQVKEHFPENTKEDSEGMGLVHYGKMIVPMLAMLQRQERRIKELEKRLAKW